MLERVFMLCFILVSFIGNSQEILTTFKNDLKTKDTKIKDVTPIVNTINGEICILISDAKNVYGYTIDNQFNVIQKLISKDKRRTYKTIIGTSIAPNGDYRLYLTNKYKTKFLTVNFSFKNQKVSSKEFQLKVIDETFIQTASYNNKFYLITNRKSRDILAIYVFDDDGNYKRQRIDLTNTRFISKTNKPITVSQILSRTDAQLGIVHDQGKLYNINQIDESIPNTIETTADAKKMYLKDNSVIFTFDYHRNFTQVLTIDLDTFKATSQQFKKSQNHFDFSRERSNSFIHNNHIFIISYNSNKLVFEIIDYKSHKKINEFSIIKNRVIDFKNSPIFYKKQSLFSNKIKEKEKSTKFLQRLRGDKIGISSRMVNDKYHITIGGYNIQQSRNPSSNLSFGNSPISFAPSMFIHNSNTRTESTRIECVFDQNFNHIKGDIIDDAFDKMQKHQLEIDKGVETIFKYKDFFIRGEYNPTTKEYILRKFDDN